MSSTYIGLTKAAIKAKLTQNEGLIFHALMMQTLGYRKSTDNLTDKRLAQLSGIRLDHFRVALDSFLQHNLFYRVEHPAYDYQYRICEEFLDETSTTIVHPPSLPKVGEVREVRENAPEVGADLPQTLVDLPEGRGHTTENLNIKKPQQQTNETEKNPFTKKQQTNHKQKKPKKTKKNKKQKHIAAPYSPEEFAKAKEADKERAQRATLWSDYQWLKQQSIMQNKPEQELATLMGMEDAYALFGGKEAVQEVACAA